MGDSRSTGQNETALSGRDGERCESRIAALERELAELKRAHETAEAERDVLSRAFESLSDGFALFDPDDRLIFCNSMFKELNPELAAIIRPGMTFEDMVRDNVENRRIVEAIGREEEFVRERMARHRNPGPPVLSPRKDGRWLLLREERTPDGSTFLVNTDLTELKRREEDFRKSEERFRAIVNNAPTKIHIKDIDGRYTLINPLAERLFGVSDTEGRGKTSHELFPGDVADIFMAHDREVAESGETTEREEVFTLEDGVHTFLTVKFPIYSEDKVTAVGAIGTDITARKRAETAMQESESRLRSIVDSSAVAITVKDMAGQFLVVNETFAEWACVDAAELVGRDIHAILPSEQAAEVEASDRQVLETGEALSGERTRTFKDGRTRNIMTYKAPILSVEGDVVAVSSIDLDITERRQIEASHQRMIAAVEEMAEMLAIYDADDRLIFSNRVHQEANAEAPEVSVAGVTFEETMRILVGRGIIDDALGREEEWIRERLDRHRNPKGPFEVRRDGDIWYEIAEQRLPDGGALLLGTDITERKRVEEQLLRAQRMEAVGQLTGGIAHDFNNLLAIMIGNAEIIESGVGNDQELVHSVNEIISAIDRGASLTSRLLAFSRRQALSPVAADLSALIGGLEDMLSRTLGETIDLRVESPPGLWAAMIDRHQFEQALINLAVNARDAMPNGGALVIETANVVLDDDYVARYEDVVRGNYVRVAVSDTGTGMLPEIREKVFEPFFTTKDVGKGSGLGLSMVYGFVKQSEGHISIYSEPNEGTTVNLYLPQSPAAVLSEDAEDETLPPPPGSERILVVEDDDNVRDVSAGILRDHGYDIVEARDGAEAIASLKSGGAFDILFTDVVLPGGIDGLRVADEAARLHPGIKILYTTGYAENAVVHHGKLDPGVNLITKPYRGAALIEKLRAVLDNMET